MHGLKTNRTASVIIRGHAFIQNLRRGHYELGVEARHAQRSVAAAFEQRNSARVCRQPVIRFEFRDVNRADPDAVAQRHRADATRRHQVRKGHGHTSPYELASVLAPPPFPISGPRPTATVVR